MSRLYRAVAWLAGIALVAMCIVGWWQWLWIAGAVCFFASLAASDHRAAAIEQQRAEDFQAEIRRKFERP